MKQQRTESPAGNSTYKKLAVQWLNEALYFVSSSVLADSFRLRNRQLLVAAKRYPTFKLRTYKVNNKSILKLVRDTFINILLLFIINHYFLKIDNIKVILITILYLIIAHYLPAILILLNYYKYNRKTEFSLSDNKITITENGISKNYDLNDVEKSIYNLGKYYQNALDRKYRIPFILSDFGYWDLTFKNGDRYFLTTLLQDFLLEECKVENTKYRFRLFPYIDKSEKIDGIELKPIEYKPKSRLEKLNENFQNKTNEELKYILDNKNKYQKEAIKVAEQILKERNVG